MASFLTIFCANGARFYPGYSMASTMICGIQKLIPISNQLTIPSVLICGLKTESPCRNVSDYLLIKTLLMELPIQLIVVGEGEGEFMSFFHDLESKYKDKVATHLKFDNVLPHLVFAGADVVLLPSRFEPCGLIQMEAMRMGTIPIVRKTGGLADSVEDYNPNNETGTGFTFERFDSSALMIALVRAFENFRDKKDWHALQKRAMSADFSWISSAKKYVALSQRAIEIHNRY